MSDRERARAIRALARLYGVQATYTDGLRQRRRAPEESVVAILRALGAPLDDARAAPAALEAEQQARRDRLIEPVVVAWSGYGAASPTAGLEQGQQITLEVAFEDGGTRAWKATPEDPLPEDLPDGYHRLRVTAGRRSGDATLIVAPPVAYQGDQTPSWGVFLPLYALRSARDWGVGSLTDLQNLIGWVAERGGDIVATLPIFAAFLGEPFDPSPYSPASRLHWNELHLDVEALPEFARSERAQDLLGSPGFKAALEELRDAPLVEHAKIAALKREVLDLLAETLAESGGARAEAFEAFLRDEADVATYASFRAATEGHGPWQGWPDPREIPAHDARARRTHAYAQFALREQLEALRAGAGDAGLYLDLPLGVHPAGYDVWRHRGVFATGAAGGAPPDGFFTKGQNWLFPPMRPDAVRAAGYAYPIACLRTLLRYATVLRIDHIIGLHRLFWIPDGFDATDGAFVRWPEPEEWYAILSLESHRARATLIGEDLGTVPRAVRHAMARHGVLRSYVLQEEFRDDARTPVARPPASSLAALNTHDMPPFASWWTEHDLVERLERGLMTEAEARRERTRRARRRKDLARYLEGQGLLDGDDVVGAALAWLAGSSARIVVAALEDLWGEVEPQNRPGTTIEYANWRQRARVPQEALAGMPEVTDRLDVIAERRGRRRR